MVSALLPTPPAPTTTSLYSVILAAAAHHTNATAGGGEQKKERKMQKCRHTYLGKCVCTTLATSVQRKGQQTNITPPLTLAGPPPAAFQLPTFLP
ncbi:hypothetical protein EYF80_001868 [Liparis tanakae]|uniref:Uncharacterized protein n=1 Tax=Liparis tanakae TaxID=230148 RepID=A0A4Z2JDJ1_9TELE|nr:hypothetical protein EYF80_001868 [Liparis tanakae]